MLVHRDHEEVERLRGRVLGPLVAVGNGRDLPDSREVRVRAARRLLPDDPAEQTRLVLPRVPRAREHAAVLGPDDLRVDECPVLGPHRFEHRLAARGVPAIPRGIRRDRLGDCRADEAVIQRRVLDRVVPRHAIGVAPVLVGLALAGVIRAVVTDKIRRIRAEEDGALAVHQTLDLRLVGRVTAQEAVLQARVAAQRDQVAGLGDRGALARHAHCRFDIERLVARWVEIQPRRGNQAIDLAHVEAGEHDIEVGRRRELIEQRSELPLVPVARDLVERDVEGLLAFQRQVDDADIDVLHAAGEENLEALVAADEGAGAPVPDQGLYESELVNRACELLIVGVARLEVDAWVVRGGVDPASGDRLQSQCAHACWRGKSADLSGGLWWRCGRLLLWGFKGWGRCSAAQWGNGVAPSPGALAHGITSIDGVWDDVARTNA